MKIKQLLWDVEDAVRSLLWIIIGMALIAILVVGTGAALIMVSDWINAVVSS